MKKCLSVILSLLLVCSMFGCSSKKEEKLVVGVSVIDMKNQFWVDWTDAMQEKADAENVELIINDAQGDVANQITVLENWLAQEVDAVVLMPIDNSVQSYVDKLRDAGIPVICGAKKLEREDGFVGVVQSEYGYNIGKAAADWVDANLADKDEVTIALLTNSTSDNLVARAEGIKKGLAEAKTKITIVAEQDAYNSDDGVSVAETILETYPDIDGFVGINDSGMLGAYNALMSSGRDTSKMFLVACDGDSQALELIKEGTCYRATVAIDKKATGAANMQQAIDAAKGNKIEDIATVTTPVNIDNVDEWIAQNS